MLTRRTNNELYKEELREQITKKKLERERNRSQDKDFFSEMAKMERDHNEKQGNEKTYQKIKMRNEIIKGNEELLQIRKKNNDVMILF